MGACRKSGRPDLLRPRRAWFLSVVAQLAQASQTAPVPPQNLEAEESVLGAMMLSPGAIGAVSEVLSAGDFYRESHAKIYRAALALYAKGEPVDAITLVDELDARSELEDVGGKIRIAELANQVPAAANAAHYARIVKEMATLRGLIRAGNEIARIATERDGETADLVDRAEKIVFAARPSMGKSALALCVAANIAVRHGLPIGLFTLEMSKAEVTQRLMCSEAKVESQRLRTGKLAADDWPRLTAACDKLAKAPIY